MTVAVRRKGRSALCHHATRGFEQIMNIADLVQGVSTRVQPSRHWFPSTRPDVNRGLLESECAVDGHAVHGRCVERNRFRSTALNAAPERSRTRRPEGHPEATLNALNQHVQAADPFSVILFNLVEDLVQAVRHRPPAGLRVIPSLLVLDSPGATLR
ncbi:hypothetical protein ACFQ3M_17870 [Micromonospora andamanensis]